LRFDEGINTIGLIYYKNACKDEYRLYMRFLGFLGKIKGYSLFMA